MKRFIALCMFFLMGSVVGCTASEDDAAPQEQEEAQEGCKDLDADACQASSACHPIRGIRIDSEAQCRNEAADFLECASNNGGADDVETLALSPQGVCHFFGDSKIPSDFTNGQDLDQATVQDACLTQEDFFELPLCP